MTKISLSSFPEVFISNMEMTKAVSRFAKNGKLRKLAPRLYTQNMIDPPELIIKRNLWVIISSYFPGALIADRTALENKPTADGFIFLVAPQKHKIKLPGITLCPRKGHAPFPNDRPFIGGLFLSSLSRAFLENIKPSRARNSESSRTLSKKEIEEKLENLLSNGGTEALNKLRDEAAKISKPLGLTEEYKSLDKLIGSLLGTKSEKLESPLGMARQTGFAYDPKRLHLFSELHAALAVLAPISRIAAPLSSEGLINLSFFEAYFSNFIEGTEFEVNEAKEIIFNGKIPPARPEDAHDILGTFKIVSNTPEMSQIPHNFEELLTLLKTRHASIMEGRPDKFPGEFKKESNRAGSTTFVAPDLVMGTLKQGFQIYQALDCPLYKAIFMMFLISEVHPFNDGNGRVGRIMMNAELVSASEQRIIIPTIYRNNYLSALRALSLNTIPDPLIRVLDFAQRYTLCIRYNDFNEAQLELKKTNAFMDPTIAEERGLRLILR
ncbi:MAG TPA: Fic family protein [Alphaproteobacteria bacterium]|nr:Fic family protein [Alphaproteobacteria bacterium]HQS94315.1 Fic family protein [Alphaproteobacteria bacterium]